MTRRILFGTALYFVFALAAMGQSGDQSGSATPSSGEGKGGSTVANLDVHKSKRIPVRIPKSDSANAITIDGKLDEEAWKTAAVFKDFLQTAPGDNIAPSKPTEAYMFFDESNLYIGFKCWDEPDKIRATVAKRDSVFSEDNVRVWLDTYDDQRRAYVLGWNPLGIQADGIFTEGRGADFSFDIVMESKGVIEDWGWAVEVKIPFKSLRYSSGPGKNWGFNAARNIDRFNDEFDTWMPDDRNTSGFLIKHGRITGLEGIKTERTLEVIPSVTLSETGRRVPSNEQAGGRFVNEPVKSDIGVTLKYAITPNITLDAAINPDFAEIEADAPVVTANQRFPLFFPEKRPFFLEGADTFQTPLQLFNSRSIVDPDLAAKLTGKIGKNSFGVLVASDNAPGNYSDDDRNDPNILPFISEFVGKNALFAVMRGKRDIGAENNIGAFFSARVFPERKNYVGGIDGRFKINKSTVFSFQGVATSTRSCFFDPTFDPEVAPDQAEVNGTICGGGIVDGEQVLGNIYSRYRTGTGFGYFANLDSTKDLFGYTIEVGGRTSDYRADAGFTRRTNMHYASGGVRLSTKSKPQSAIIRTNWFVGGNYMVDGKGRLINRGGESNLNVSLQRNTFFNFFTGTSQEKLYEEEFGLVRNDNRDGTFFGEASRNANQFWAGAFFRTAPSKLISFYTEFSFQKNIFDFDFGAGPKFPRVSPAALDGEDRLDPGTGTQIYFNPGVEIAPTDPLRISLDYIKSRLVRNDTKLTAFDTNIVSLNSTYAFSRFVFTRVRLDYNTLQSSLRGQYLFGWTPSPGKAFYVGYNDDLSYNGFSPFTGLPENGFQRNNRKFFIRMSYLFRKSF